MIYKSKEPIKFETKNFKPKTTFLLIAIVFTLTRVVNVFIFEKLPYSLITEIIISLILVFLEVILVLYCFLYRPIGIPIFPRKQAKELQGSYSLHWLKYKLTHVQQQKQEIYHVYSDVIFAMTQGKFNLLDFEQILPLSQEGILLAQMDLNLAKDVNRARKLMSQILQEQEPDPRESYHIILCVSEATTNVIKHAEYGHLSIRKFNGYLRVYISDYGPGMDLKKLPKSVFFEGYSTKNSMGVGFSLMYKYAEKIYLSPLEDGTELILDFKAG